MSKVSSRTTLLVGPYTIQSEDDDPPVLGTRQLADGWTITRQLDDSQVWPQQPSEVASFSVYAGTADDVSSITEGARVSITYRSPRAGGVRLTFLGRVTDAVVRAHPLGVVVDATAVDYRHADLGELLIGDAPWPAESAKDRMARIMALVGVTYTHTQLGVIGSYDTYPGSLATVAARDVDSQPALGIIDRLLDSWVVDYSTTVLPFGVTRDYGLNRHHLVPWTIDVNGLVTEWRTVPVSAQLEASTDLPGTFGDTTADGAPGYGVLVPVDATDRAEGVVSSDYVDLSSAAFSQRRGKRPNTVAVKWLSAGVEATATASNGTLPASAFRLETDLTQSAAAARAAALYLPDAGGTDWYADAMSWRWYADTWAQADALPDIGAQVTIAPVQDRHSPIGRPWYTGILTQLVFKMAKAQPVVDITVRPQVRRILAGSPAAGLTWDSLPVGVKWNDLNTRDTWDDYQLLRT